MKAFKKFLIILSLISVEVWAQPIPQDVQKCVSFLFINHPALGFIPYGTGFFVSVDSEKDSISFGYFVTSKHVFQDDQKKYFNEIFIRINRKDGLSDTIALKLFEDGRPLFFTHKDSTVDIVVYPLFPDVNTYDCLFIPSTIITTEDIYKSKNIREGDEAFFTGLFTKHFGTVRNIPIVRFGKVALISEEKVLWDNVPTDLYLIETTSFGGNSGSPLFFTLGATREPNKISFGYQFFLGGIIQGYFGEFTQPGLISTLPQKVWPVENSGIAAVVPAKKLYEILFSEDVSNMRNNIITKSK